MSRARDFAWEPTEEVRNAANLTGFIKAAALDSYEDLEGRCEADPDWFWDALIRHLGIRFSVPYERVLDLADGIEWPRWCVGGRLNMVQTCLDRHLEANAARSAIIWEGEDGEVRRWTYADLGEQINRLAAGLKSLGIGAGERVGIYMPMLPETAAAFLAVAKIGGIIVPLFSGFGVEALVSRLGHAEAVAVITARATLRRGRRVEMKAVMDQVAPRVASLRHVVVLERGNASAGDQSCVSWKALVERNEPLRESEPLDAEQPLMVVYTSGTTGRPKGTVHTHCGFLAKTGLDWLLGFDLKPTDTLIWPSDMGWLVGSLQIVAVTLAGATLVMAEGAPDYPETDRLWRMIADHRVTFLGTTPTAARSLRRYGTEAVARHDLSSLRVVASTGEPWDPDSWMWVFDTVCRRRAPLMNYSGGTELGGLVTTNILHPMKPGGFYGPCLGTGADIVDARGRSVATGEIGELVMTRPSIGTTQGLWRDRERYLETYWRRIPGVWVHGDLASRDADGCWFVHGRSDDTIKIAGKRTGPAEVEAILMETGKVDEAAAVGLPDAIKGAALVCVVVLAENAEPGEALAAELSAAVTLGLGAAYRPREIVFAADLPKTRNMKVMRRVVRAVLLGEEPGDLSSLVNPEAIEELRDARKRPA
jgi:acetyl-CoA synthetase